METKLRKLFDYQKFEQNRALEHLISETGNRYTSELSDDSLSLVNAAGELPLVGEPIRSSKTPDTGSAWGRGPSGEILIPPEEK